MSADELQPYELIAKGGRFPCAGVGAVADQGSKMSTTRNNARLNVRLPSELKQTIEEAAAVLGQSISDFTISAVVREARHVIQDAQMTRLSNRDRDAFLAALESADTKPCDALKKAARRYKKRVT